MNRMGHKRNIETTVVRGIKYFDMYVRINDRFIATKGEFIIHGFHRVGRQYAAAVYRDRQTTKRCLAYASGGSLEWCRNSVIDQIQKIYLRREKE